MCTPPTRSGLRVLSPSECVVLQRNILRRELASQVLCSLRLGVLVCSTGESAQQARGLRGETLTPRRHCEWQSSCHLHACTASPLPSWPGDPGPSLPVPGPSGAPGPRSSPLQQLGFGLCRAPQHCLDRERRLTVPRATRRPQSHFLLLLPQRPFGSPRGSVGASHQGQDPFTIHAQA